MELGKTREGVERDTPKSRNNLRHANKTFNKHDLIQTGTWGGPSDRPVPGNNKNHTRTRKSSSVRHTHSNDS